jgi:Carboxypeptidase regulatory-like domain
VRLLFAAVLLLLSSLAAVAQTGQGSLRGTVTDPSGAVVVNATVALVTADGKTISASTNKSGVYELRGIAPGKYTVTANAQGFSVFVQDDVDVPAGPLPKAFNISLQILVQEQKVDVQEQTTQVSTNPENNVGAIVLTGKDLDALSDDPDELLEDLQALAGPSAGPNGGQLYIDGFTGGQLPPKSSIREIRINQNPFSAQYDKLGYGRIEVFTKPGTDKFHGQISILGNSSAFNSKSPFLTTEPDYYSTQYQGNIAGPINKKASFFFDFQRRNIDEVSVVNATILNPACLPGVPTSCDPANAGVPYATAYPNPHTRTTISPRVDFQLSKNNTLTARYQYWRDTEDNNGVGGLTLPSQGYNSGETEHTFQISDTQIINTKIVNETRFQYMRDISNQTPQNLDTSITVVGAFGSGGSEQGTINDTTNHYELQNYTSIAQGAHVIKFGARIRGVQETNTTTANFGGTYFFPSIEAYAQTVIDPLHYQLATQYTQVSGGVAPGGTTPLAPTGTSSISWMDAGLYFQDDWKFRQNLTLSYGLRFETQNQIHDHADWAPRLSFAWGIDGSGKKAAKTVLRAGFGMFYDRFNEVGILSADRFNGIDQVSYIVRNPIFTNPPQPPTNLQTNSPTIYQINPGLHAPYAMQTAVSLERQVTMNANLAVSYLNSRGVHQFYSHNINAPIGSINPDDPSVRPFHNLDNIYQYASEGTYKQQQLIINSNVKVGAKLSLFGYYTLNYADANANGLSTFSSNQYDLRPDWGRAQFDRRNRMFLGGTVAAPYGVRFNPFIILVSGIPYNVTVGQDLNGDSIYNDRPAFAANLTSACISPTAACHYDPQPAPDQARVPINYLTGPTNFSVNLRVSKTFGFGKEVGASNSGDGGPGGPGGGGGRGGGGGGGGRGPGGFGRASGSIGLGSATSRRYALIFSVSARNLFNRENLGTPVGNITSPKFGESIQLAQGGFSSQAASRKIELQASFSF